MVVEDVFQNYLHRVTDAFLTGDYDTWEASVSLPATVVTRNGTTVITSTETLKRDFEVYMREFEIHGITDMIRLVQNVQLIEGDQMTGTYTTHILRNAEPVVDPYESAMTLRLMEGTWRMTTLLNAIGHLNWSQRMK